MATFGITLGEFKRMEPNLGTAPKAGERIWIHVCSHMGQIHGAVVSYVGVSYFESYIEHLRMPGVLQLFCTCLSLTCGCGWYSSASNHAWYDQSRAASYLSAAGRAFRPPEAPSSAVPPWIGAPTRKAPTSPAPLLIPGGYSPTETVTRRGPVTCTGKHCPDPCNPYAEPNQPDGSFKCYSCRGGITR